MKQNDSCIKRKKTGIRLKLFVSLVFFVCVIVLLLWLCQVVFFDSIYSFFKTKEIKASGIILKNAVNGKTVDRDELDKLTKSTAKNNDVCILIVQMIGEGKAFRIASADVLSNCAIHSMADSGVFTLYRSAVENSGSALQFFSYDAAHGKFNNIDSAVTQSGDNDVYMIYSEVAYDSDGNSILIILNSIVSPVGATVRTLNVILIAISALMILLALLLAFYLSNRISSPIIKMNKSAKELAEGNYGADFSGDGYREISELGSSLSYAASELSKVDTLRKELIANVSHDLRTPLTLISGYGEVMRDIPGENTPENVQVIIDEAQRLSSLVNAMLDISKLESGNINVNIENFDLTAAITEALGRYQKFTESDGYSISFEQNGCRVYVNSDKTLFLQAFYNLINNAINHAGDDKKVMIRQEIIFSKEGKAEKVRISVSDTGEGISEENLPLIWDRYFKVDKTHKRDSVGTGLGLSIVKKVMNMLGGSCGVESTVGIGSTFWLELNIDH